jgi:hypothetical protein
VKTTTLAVLLSVLSLGGVAMLYVKVDDLGEQLKMSRANRDSSERTRAGEARPEYVIRKGDTAARQGESEEPAASAIMPKTVEQRLARLEQKQSERSKSRGWSAPSFRAPRFARNVGDLGKQLKLTATQKDRIESAISRGKARIEEILSIPGSDGKTIKELRAESRKKIQEAISNPEKNAGTLVTLAMSGHKRMGEKIPGRNETYRQEVDRIKKETREEINGSLDPDQQEQFKDTRIDPMLGDGGGHMAFSTSISMGGGEGDAPMGGIMIAEDVSVESADESPQNGEKDE